MFLFFDSILANLGEVWVSVVVYLIRGVSCNTHRSLRRFFSFFGKKIYENMR